MRDRILGLALLVLLAAGAWYLLGPEGAVPDSPAVGRPGAALRPPPAAETALDNSPASDSAREEFPAPRDSFTPAQAAVPPVPAAPAVEALLASGVVVNELGRPVAGSEIHWLEVPEGVPPGGEQSLASAAAGSDGHFELHGRSASGRGRLRAAAPEYLPTVLDVPAGLQGLRLVLQAPAALAGRLLLDPSVPPASLHLRLLGADGALVARTLTAEDGGFAYDDLASENYTLEIASQPESPAIERVSELYAKAGERLLDPRLDPLDLRGRLVHFELRVLDRAGQPVPAGMVAAGAPEYFADGSLADPRLLFEAFQQGRAALTLQAASVRAVVLAPGFRSVLLEDVHGRLELRLEPAPPLHIKLVGSAVQLLSEVELGVQLVLPGGPGLGSFLPSAYFDATRELELASAGPGLYELHWLLREVGDGSNWSFAPSEPITFELRPEDSALTVEVDFDLDALRGALDAQPQKR